MDTFSKYCLFLLLLLVLSCTKEKGPQEIPVLAGFQSFSLSDGDAVYNAFEIADGHIYVSVPNGKDLRYLKATFLHDGKAVYVDKREQESGVTLVDFSRSTAPVRYNVVSKQGRENHYDVFLFDLPVVYIDTPGGQEIVDKENWIPEASIRIIDTDGSVALESGTSIKGRGNTTWEYPKKPYTLKLDSKQKVLGMPADKRWNLLANWADRTLMRNTAALAISARTKHLEWTPRGRHVEVILNGRYLGNYYLCEHIKIAKNRIPIREMDTAKDIEGEALTGGYMLEIDSHFDEPLKFRTPIRNLPVNLKSPDTDVRDVQFNYIRDYINTLESMLADEARLEAREYADYLDIDSFIDYFLVHELAEYSGPADDAYSSHVYKDMSGKLKAGPVWDFDRTTFKPNVTKFLNAGNALWYGYLFKDPVFVARLKEKWAESKPEFEKVVGDIEDITYEIRRSARYTIKMWPTDSRDNGDETMSFDDAALRLKNAYAERIKTLDVLIGSL
ncbi:MAG: CotH kinase family protein [Bacteroidales bacterium]|nr:CotH kinase family protein [Bacteroidales bacterium]